MTQRVQHLNKLMRYVPAEVTWAAGTILKCVYMVMAVPKMLRYKVLFRAALSTANLLRPSPP